MRPLPGAHAPTPGRSHWLAGAPAPGAHWEPQVSPEGRVGGVGVWCWGCRLTHMNPKRNQKKKNQNQAYFATTLGTRRPYTFCGTCVVVNNA